MIKAESLTKKYGTTTAIENISFEIKKGEILGFLGPNGAGKSTTMRILTGVIPPSSGKAYICGIDVENNPLEAKKKIGYLPEGITFYNEMNVITYLEFAAESKGTAKNKQRGEINSAMEQCGITNVSHRIIGHLSKGYRQRVGLAQALINNPEVLILDEPTIGLDPQQIISIRALIKSMAGTRTVILSTHILQEVTNICSQVAIINQGKIYAHSSIDELNKQSSGTNTYECEVKGDYHAVISVLNRVNGVINISIKDEFNNTTNRGRYLIITKPSVDLRETIVSELYKNNLKLLELYSLKSSLEDTFIKVISEA